MSNVMKGKKKKKKGEETDSKPVHLSLLFTS